MPIRIVRMANIYGPGDTHLDRIVPGIITDTLAGIRREHRGDPRWIRDFIYVDDLIPALIRISTEPKGIYNLGGDYCSLQHIAELIPRLMGRDDLQPIWTYSGKNEIPFQHIVDCPDWWKPQTSLVEGLLKTIEYYSERIWDGVLLDLHNLRFSYLFYSSFQKYWKPNVWHRLFRSWLYGTISRDILADCRSCLCNWIPRRYSL